MEEEKNIMYAVLNEGVYYFKYSEFDSDCVEKITKKMVDEFYDGDLKKCLYENFNILVDEVVEI